MSDKSLWTESMEEILGELRDLREDSQRSQQTRFMHEKVKPSELLERTRTMTTGERKQLRNELGDEAVLRMLRGGRNG